MCYKFFSKPAAGAFQVRSITHHPGGVSANVNPDRSRTAARAKRYAAFLSYSHTEDQFLAPVLQRALQRFAKPFYALRRVQIFRDETDLGVSPGLWPKIEEALADSQYYLLLASPAAAQSTWVKRELDCWLRLHHGDASRILIVWTRGTLAWDPDHADFNWSATDALPELLDWKGADLPPRSLRGQFRDEPLYVDLRWAKEKADLSERNPVFLDDVASIAATINERPKNELVGAEVSEHRKFRRAAISLLTTLAAMLVASITMGVVAVQRRAEAENARALAEFRSRVALSRQLASESLTRTQPQSLALRTSMAILALDSAPTLESNRALRNALGYLVPSLAFRGSITRGSFVMFSPNQRDLVVSQASGAVCGWDPATAQAHPCIERHFTPSLTSRGERSPDRETTALDRGQRYLATAGINTGPDHEKVQGVEVWDTVDSRLLFQAPMSSGVRALAIGSDSRTLVLSRYDGKLQVWDMVHRANVTTIDSPGADSVALNSTSSVLAYDSWNRRRDSTSIVIVDLIHGSRIGTVSLRGNITSIAFSPDDKWLAAGNSDGSTVLWDVARRRVMATIPGIDDVTSVVFSPDSQSLAISSGFSTRAGQGFRDPKRPSLSVWSVPDGKLMLEAPQQGEVTAFTYLGTGQVAVASRNFGIFEGSPISVATIWDLRTGKERGRILHEEPILSLSADRDGKLLASLDKNTVKLWKLDGYSADIKRRYPEAAFESLAVSADGRLLATNLRGKVTLWNRKDAGEPSVLDTNAFKATAFSADGQQLATGGVVVTIWNTATRTPVSTLADSASVGLLSFGGRGRQLATVTQYDGAIWDLKARTKALSWHSSQIITALALNAAETLFATGEFGGQVRIRSAVDGQDVLTVNVDSSVTSVEFMPSGDRVVILNGLTLHIVPIEGKEKSVQVSLIARGTSLALSDDGRYAAIGYGGISPQDMLNGVSIWDLTNLEEIDRIDYSSEIDHVAFAPGGVLLAQDRDFTVTEHIWASTPLRQAACERIRSSYSDEEWRHLVSDPRYDSPCNRP